MYLHRQGTVKDEDPLSHLAVCRAYCFGTSVHPLTIAFTRPTTFLFRRHIHLFLTSLIQQPTTLVGAALSLDLSLCCTPTSLAPCQLWTSRRTSSSHHITLRSEKQILEYRTVADLARLSATCGTPPQPCLALSFPAFPCLSLPCPALTNSVRSYRSAFSFINVRRSTAAMAPMGPSKGPAVNSRGLRSAQANTGRASTRGGISKRRGAGPVKVDRDGDLSMDASTSNNASQSHPRRPKSNAAPPGTVTRTSTRNPRPTAKAQQIIQRVINIDTSQISARTRSSLHGTIAPLVTLKVEGLKASRAASNQGGGLRELLSFLERKAQAIGQLPRNIKIRKVCYSFVPTGLGGYEATHILRNRCYAI